MNTALKALLRLVWYCGPQEGQEDEQGLEDDLKIERSTLILLASSAEAALLRQRRSAASGSECQQSSEPEDFALFLTDIGK